MVESIWPHPRHKNWALLGTILELMALVLAAAGILLEKWFKTKESQYGVFDSKVKCFNTFCTTQPISMEEDPWVMMSSSILLGGLATNALAVVVIVFVFWPMIAKNKFSSFVLEFALVLTIISAYMKFLGNFIVVHFMTKVNENFILQYDQANIEVNSLPLGWIFLSFCLEMTTLVAFRVTLDKGIKGLSHIDRISEIENEEGRAKAASQRDRSSSVYHPDTSEEHNQILTKASKSSLGGSSKRSRSLAAE